MEMKARGMPQVSFWDLPQQNPVRKGLPVWKRKSLIFLLPSTGWPLRRDDNEKIESSTIVLVSARERWKAQVISCE